MENMACGWMTTLSGAVEGCDATAAWPKGLARCKKESVLAIWAVMADLVLSGSQCWVGEDREERQKKESDGVCGKCPTEVMGVGDAWGP